MTSQVITVPFNTYINGLPSAGQVGPSDQTYIEQSGVSKKIPVKYLQGYAINVQSFGAVCDGVTDDTLALQAAITFSQNNNGAPVFIPAFCHITSPLSITGYTQLIGTGADSGLKPTVSIDAIDINTSAAIILKDFTILYPGAANAGTKGISVTATTGENISSLFENIQIDLPYYGIYFTKASQFTIKDCVISAPGNSAIVVQNTNNVDSGDSTIENTKLLTCGSAALFFASSGGLRFINNKINVAPVGILIELANGAAMTGLYVSNNSIEGIGPSVGSGGSGAAIQLSRSGTTGTLFAAHFTANEMTGQFGVYVPTDANGTWINGLTVEGGSFQGNPGLSTAAIDIDSVVGFNIGSGMVVLPSSGGSTFPVITGSAANYGRVFAPLCTPILLNGLTAGTCNANSISSSNTTTV